MNFKISSAPDSSQYMNAVGEGTGRKSFSARAKKLWYLGNLRYSCFNALETPFRRFRVTAGRGGRLRFDEAAARLTGEDLLRDTRGLDASGGNFDNFLILLFFRLCFSEEWYERLLLSESLCCFCRVSAHFCRFPLADAVFLRKCLL